jgi:Flp pilus assembly protein TadG
MFVRFIDDQKGTIALIFGLAVIPITAMVGVALDYSRAAEYRTFLSREADVAALAIASSDTPNTDTVKSDLRTRALTHFGAAGARNPVQTVDVTSDWESSSILTVTVTSNYRTSILSALPAMPTGMNIAATTQVSRTPAQWRWQLPSVAMLSYEAADYNQIYVYCYDEKRKNEADGGRRAETFTAIADNGANAATRYSNVTMPQCRSGETLSFLLRNVRDARTDPNKWNAAVDNYMYATDTAADPNTRILTNTVSAAKRAPNGSLTPFDITNTPMLETILCDTLAQCKFQNQGGILPNEHVTHNPATASTGCAEGKYMYYGWEDRPNVPAGSSDRDYDDIRIVVSCPTLVQIANKMVKIIK